LVQVLIQHSFTAKIIRRCGADTLDDIRATPYPKISPSEAVNVYGVFQYGPTVEYVPLTGSHPSISPKVREKLPPHS
jgi:hypothetical protein